MYLDVKSFKGFNAAFGYATGDRVLLDLNGTLAGMKAADERYAHVIADEFVLLVRWRGWDEMCIRDSVKHAHRSAENVRTMSETAARRVETTLETGANGMEPTWEMREIRSRSRKIRARCTPSARKTSSL